jgi:hypothetical protein
MPVMYVEEDLPPFFDPDVLPRVISRADAMTRGMSRHAIDRRVASGRWRRVLPRTYLTADTLSDLDRLNAALAFAGNGAALSAAAALHASGVRRIAVPHRILVLVPPSNCVASAGWVQVRRSVRPFEFEQWIGPRRVEVARATSDLAVMTRRLDDVRALVARVIQGGHCTLGELGAELAAGPRRGSAHFRQALTEIGWGAASAPEAEAARVLRQAGITGFEQNARLDLPDGTFRVVDFYWPALRACLEIDSIEFHFERDDYVATLDRHLDLSKFGYSVIHRPPSALDHEARFVRDVRDWLAGREADLRRGIG